VARIIPLADESRTCSTEISGPIFEGGKPHSGRPAPVSPDRLVLHLLRGLAIAWLLYPKLSEEERQVEKRRWSRTLLSILAVSVRERNAPKELPDRCMLVLNHISWVDIFVVDARFPATFIAKSEIRTGRW